MEQKTANMVGKGTKDSTNRFHTYDGSIALETLKGMVILYSISIFDAYIYIRIYIYTIYRLLVWNMLTQELSWIINWLQYPFGGI